MFLFLMTVFLANNLLTNIILIAFVLILLFLSQIKLSFFLDGLKPMIGIILFTTIFQILFTNGQQVYWSFGWIHISREGLVMGGIIFVRFLLIVFFSTLLTLTTTPLSLADAVESLLKPFKYLGLPTHEIGLMLSMSLRFVPTLMDDTNKIMNAQRARGVEFGQGSLINRIKTIIPILIPLFASSFNRAEALATAIEARGYQGGEGRSKYRILKWKTIDHLAIISLFLLILALYLLKN